MEVVLVITVMIVGALNIAFYEYRVHKNFKDSPKTFDFTGSKDLE